MEKKTFSESCREMLQSEIVKRTAGEVMRPLSALIYDAIYPYIWMICIYNVFLFVLILANFLLLLKFYMHAQKN